MCGDWTEGSKRGLDSLVGSLRKGFREKLMMVCTMAVIFVKK